MKKLTAGIFTVLMGLVSVNAADAAVASKGYVDNKFFTKQAQTEHVAAQKVTDDAQDVNINKNTGDIATNAGVIASNAGKIGNATFTDDTLNYIKGETNLTAAVKKLDAAVTDASSDLSNVYTKTEADAKFIDTTEIEEYATGAELTAVSEVANAADTLSKTNKGAITVLNGDENTEGSVAKKIKTVTSAYQAADTALSERIEQLSGGSATKAELNAAITAEVTRSNKYTDDAVAAEVTRSNNYTDAEVKELADGAVATNTAAIATNTAAIATNKAAISENADAILAIKDGTTGVLVTAKKYADDQDAAQTTAITTAYKEADAAALQTAQGYANAAESAAKTYTDGQIGALNLKAISRVPAECGNAGNYCVLTTNGTKFVWEVIVRDDATLGEGDTGLYGDYSATEPAVTE